MGAGLGTVGPLLLDTVWGWDAVELEGRAGLD